MNFINIFFILKVCSNIYGCVTNILKWKISNKIWIHFFNMTINQKYMIYISPLVWPSKTKFTWIFILIWILNIQITSNIPIQYGWIFSIISYRIIIANLLFDFNLIETNSMFQRFYFYSINQFNLFHRFIHLKWTIPASFTIDSHRLFSIISKWIIY